jgi:serine/threonine protein kinase
MQWDLPETSRENEYWQDDGAKDLKMPDDLRTRETCEYTADWQFAYHPSCNSIHETALNDLGSKDGYDIKLVNNGAFRDVWRIREFDGVYRVMKTLRLIPKRKFDQRNFDRHRRDALAFEQLAPSPHVVDIYGHCSNSAVFDLCSGGDLFQIRPLAHPPEPDDEEEPTETESPIPMPTSKRLLEVAIVVAKSVADAHHMDEEGRPTIAHTDIKPDQWILGSDGNFRLNDFNRARFLSWDTATEEVCPFTVGKNPGLVSIF